MAAIITGEFGVYGLGVMGRMLALNAARKGMRVAGWDREPDAVERFVASAVDDEVLLGAQDPAAFCQMLDRPRRILMMVPAGAPVDQSIEALAPHLEAGDILVDGGNSHPMETERRTTECEARGFHFVGMGVSGGEKGALEGPSLMPGGSAEAWHALRPVLETLAAHNEHGACVGHMGTGGAGHFVKTVHNGIEYADMQLLAEVWDLMVHACGMDARDAAAAFRGWQDGPLSSFLVETTARVLEARDAETGGPLVDVIVDAAGQKGTGRWTGELALEFGVPVPTIQAAVLARGLSAHRDLRLDLAPAIASPTPPPVEPGLLDDLAAAFEAARICAFAQGFHLMHVVSEARGWNLPFAEVARVWTDGCILRSALLPDLMAAYGRDAKLRHLLLDAPLRATVERHQSALRRVVAAGVRAGVPTLALGSATSYWDSLRRARLPQNLTQGQRDCFGAHGFERRDRPGEKAHHAW